MGEKLFNGGYRKILHPSGACPRALEAAELETANDTRAAPRVKLPSYGRFRL